MSERMETTHYEGCEKNHPECAYRVGYLAGLEAAAKVCEAWREPSLASAIRAMKDKPS